MSPSRTAASLLAVGLTLATAGCRQMGGGREHAPAQPTKAQAAEIRHAFGRERADARPSKSQAADLHYALGRSMENQKEIEKATTAYREALKRDPSHVDAMIRLAILNDRQGNFPESDRLYESALKLRPRDANLLSDRGYSLSLQRRWAEAETSLRRAIALEPAHQKAHNNLGLVLGHGMKADAALAEFRKAGCSEADARVNLAFVEAVEGQWPEARDQYRRALAADPASSHARKGLHDVDRLIAGTTPKPTADPSLKQVSLTRSASPKPKANPRPSSTNPPTSPAPTGSSTPGGAAPNVGR